jgi:DNA invertase Pin-like site-specific DNA recombinase
MGKVYAYIRVSTDKQTVENQRFAINIYCQKQGFQVNEWVEEIVSGTKRAKDRLLGGLIDKLQTGDMLICSELSRVGRSMGEFFLIIDNCFQRKITVHGIKEGFRSNERTSMYMAGIYAVFAQMERDRISDRTKEALAKRKADGMILGRKKGEKPKNTKFSKLKPQILEMLNSGKTKIEISEKLGISREHITRFLRNKPDTK